MEPKDYRQKLIVHTPDREQHTHKAPSGFDGVGWSEEHGSLLVQAMTQTPSGTWIHDLVLAEYTQWSRVERAINVPAGEEK